VSLPGAAELFRVTGDAEPDDHAGRGPDGDRGTTPRALREADAGSDDDPWLDAPARPEREDERRPVRSDGGASRVAAAGRAAADHTADEPADRADPHGDPAGPSGDEWGRLPSRPVRRRPRVSDRRPTGRERHDEKITVYCSPEELLDLEHARLTLRGDFGLAVDRGRIVREAMAVVLADLDAKGESSILVRRLRGRA
jgi:hypothetical protein